MRKLIGSRFWAAYCKGLSRYIGELQNFERLPEEERQRITSEKLISQLRYFGSRHDSLLQWREGARCTPGADFWTMWRALPIMTKDTLRRCFDPAETLKMCSLKGRISQTGGSTGEPTRFVIDDDGLRAQRACDYFSRISMGWHPDMRTLVVWGSDLDIGKSVPRKMKCYHWVRNERYFRGFRIGEETVQSILRVLDSREPTAIFGFSSMLGEVAERTLRIAGESYHGSLSVAWSGGEMLTPQHVSVFRQAFGVPVFDRYGGRELSTIACQTRETANLKVLRPLLFVEVVDEQGRPCAPGEVGRILCTSTANRGTPFLRYEIGDLAVVAPSGEDECGVHSLVQLHGRVGGVLRLADGKMLSSLYWNHLFKDFAEIRRFQVHAGKDGVKISLASAELSDSRRKLLERVVRGTLGTVPFAVEVVPQLELTRQGKLMQVIVDPEWYSNGTPAKKPL